MRFLAATVLAALVSAGSPAGAHPIAGTWRGAAAGQEVVITLGPDGRFARRDGMAAASAMTITGTWTIAPDGPWLRLTIEDWAPRRACGLFGCTDLPMLPRETYRFVLQDRDTLVIEESGAPLALRRAG